jgi:hypothetical protein
MEPDLIPEILRPLANMLLHEVIDVEPPRAEQTNDICCSVVSRGVELPIPIGFRQLGAEFAIDDPELLTSGSSREFAEPFESLHLISI